MTVKISKCKEQSQHQTHMENKQIIHEYSSLNHHFQKLKALAAKMPIITANNPIIH